ncbi:MAG: LamG domain-containing protein [Gemmatimonadetes bacterium]|nr:LamG domain-containing protein [Gemmatimonadota bacterium]
MEIVGYSDPLTARPGDSVRFMVSTARREFRARIVRLVHGDVNPMGPGFVEREVDASVNGAYPGREQLIWPGSYVEVADHPALKPQDLTVIAHVYPTTPDLGRQGIVTKWSEHEATGYGLFVAEDGSVEFRIGNGDTIVRASSGHPLTSHRWHLVAGWHDTATGTAGVVQIPLERAGTQTGQRWQDSSVAGPRALSHTERQALLAASWTGERAGHHFNGKISAPMLLAKAPSSAESVLEWAAEGASMEGIIARWDLAEGSGSPSVTDRSGNGLHGTAVNMPTRGVTGHRWAGRATHFRDDPDEYDAIHFHDDDIDDVGWEPDVEWRVPDDLPSGVYGLRLDAGDSARDCVPFFVVPRAGSATADVAFLAPTNSYYAYANERLEDSLGPDFQPAYTEDQDRYDYMAKNRLLSMYDRHSDGSGVCYSSRLRPNLTMRPSHYMRSNGIPHLFSGDLHLVDWLEHEGHGHDVLTDEALHFDGASLLEGYRVVITGTHPEYWSAQMLDALDEYLAGGGRLMYLGGNGFYWVTAFDPERPHVIEIRRTPGTTRAWEAAPGEYHLSSTGEPGGLWRHRGREPQKLLGVGFTAQGFDRNAPYYVNPDLDPRAAFVFDGIDTSDGKFGDHPSLVLRHGAAGFELDRTDYVLGTPVGTLLLASTRNTDFSDSYQHVVEEIMMSNSRQGATVNELVRADMVIVPYPQGGAVFSVGSISWCGGLSIDGYNSDVSVVTRNVLNAFLQEDWSLA